MSGKIVLIVIGAILLLLGILLLVAASNHAWEVKEYKKTFNKDPPSGIKTTSDVVGGILTVGGLVLIAWGLAQHTGVVKHMSK